MGDKFRRFTEFALQPLKTTRPLTPYLYEIKKKTMPLEVFFNPILKGVCFYLRIG